MIASTSTGADAVLEEPAVTSDIDAGTEAPLVEDAEVPEPAASAWPVILDQIFPKMLMDVSVWEKKTNRSGGRGSSSSLPSKSLAASDALLGLMAYDHGTFKATMTPPGGKPETSSSAYLNVWRKMDGKWKLVAEMSVPVADKKM